MNVLHLLYFIGEVLQGLFLLPGHSREPSWRRNRLRKAESELRLFSLLAGIHIICDGLEPEIIVNEKEK